MSADSLRASSQTTSSARDSKPSCAKHCSEGFRRASEWTMSLTAPYRVSEAQLAQITYIFVIHGVISVCLHHFRLWFKCFCARSAQKHFHHNKKWCNHTDITPWITKHLRFGQIKNTVDSTFHKGFLQTDRQTDRQTGIFCARRSQIKCVFCKIAGCRGLSLLSLLLLLLLSLLLLFCMILMALPISRETWPSQLGAEKDKTRR